MDSVNNGFTTFFVHLRTMLWKNYLVSKRGWKGTIVQIIAPALFVILLFGLNNLPSGLETNPPIVPLITTIPRCTPGVGKCYTLVYSMDYRNSTALNDTVADQIMQMIAAKNNLGWIDHFDPEGDGVNTIMKFPSLDEMNNFVINNPNTTQSAIVFATCPSSFCQGWSWETNPNEMQYSIFYNGTRSGGFGGGGGFENAPFEIITPLQYHSLVSALTIRARTEGVLGPNEEAEINVQTRIFPQSAEFEFDGVQQFGSLFFYCALMFNFSIFLYQIVNEKQYQLRQGMRMIGLSDTAYWGSWLATNLLFVTAYTLVIIIMGYICGLTFFLRTHFLVLFITFFLFGLSMTSISLLIGMFLTSTRQAINIGMTVFVVGTVVQIIFANPFIIWLLYWDDIASPAYRTVLQFYPPFNFSKIMFDISNKARDSELIKLEGTNPGLLFKWSDLYEKNEMELFVIPEPVFSWYYQIMCFSIYGFLAWLFYNISPSEKAQPIWFLFTRDYWGSWCGTSAPELPPVEIDTTDHPDVQQEAKTAHSSNDELRVLNLHKQFYKFFRLKKSIYAVKGVSLSIKKGQIFALLGHNGAGKTTTLNMLTGLIRPSSGEAILFEESLNHNLPAIQKMIGVCPQHNILWPELTSREHMTIFANLKGVPKEEQEEQIKARLKDVLLWDVADKQSGQYSGGMKRRLSVAISAIGDPRILFLDEPTTGLDPMSRREIWSAIQKLKKDRIVILTSHSMEESEALGDRIGIMAHGKLKCIGTSLHLKNLFGLGYRLNLSCEPQNVEHVKRMVSDMIPQAELIAETGGNFIYGVRTANMPQVIPLFKYIEQNRNQPGFFIKEWGLSQTTLEEVFLKVTSDDHKV